MKIKIPAKVPSFYPTIVDAASLFDACDAIAERLGRAKITLDYTKLRERLESMRALWGWRPASPNIILLSVDPSSEGQQRFLAMLKHSGFEPDVVHYRDTFVSVPPGRNPSEMAGKPIVSFAPRIAYIAGLLARNEKHKPELLIVSHSFELCGPLTDLAMRLFEGKVGLAYFGSLLDYRWKAAGLFERPNRLPPADDNDYRGPDATEAKQGLKFFDLDRHCKELLGVEFAETPSASVGFQATALGRF